MCLFARQMKILLEWKSHHKKTMILQFFSHFKKICFLFEFHFQRQKRETQTIANSSFHSFLSVYYSVFHIEITSQITSYSHWCAKIKTDIWIHTYKNLLNTRKYTSLECRKRRKEAITKVINTCWISFSISPARITSGPRTAYSILITFGFIESNVNVRFVAWVDIVLRWSIMKKEHPPPYDDRTELAAAVTVDDWFFISVLLQTPLLLIMFEFVLLFCRWIPLQFVLFAVPRFNTEFKHRLVEIILFSIFLFFSFSLWFYSILWFLLKLKYVMSAVITVLCVCVCVWVYFARFEGEFGRCRRSDSDANFVLKFLYVTMFRSKEKKEKKNAKSGEVVIILCIWDFFL